MRQHWRPLLTLSFAFVFLLTSACTTDVGDICVEASDHFEECLGVDPGLADDCDEARAEELLSATCGDLQGSEKADVFFWRRCEITCTQVYGDADDPRCPELCRDLGLYGAGGIGSTCEPDDVSSCTDGFCHPLTNTCTQHCAGVCPGENTFCVAEPQWHSALLEEYEVPANPLGGICVLKAEELGDCFNIYGDTYRVMVRTAYCSVEVVILDYEEEVWRYLGGSDAQPSQSTVCLPTPERWRLCGGDGI